MRTELEQLISNDPSLPGSGFDVPVFLDSEDLMSLELLQDNVQNSLNLALLLTTNVLTRPWCLVEIFTAVKNGVPILPVEVPKPGNTFSFPLEGFYFKMLNGDILDEKDAKVLSDCNIDLRELVLVIRTVFK